MIKIVGDSTCAQALVESDPWTALRITWLPKPCGSPLRLHAAGDRGGWVELKVDPATGRLAQLVVIDLPPLPLHDHGETAERRHGPGLRVPVVDRSLWDAVEKSASDGAGNGGAMVSVTAGLGFCYRGEELLLTFAEVGIARYLHCGNVTVGLTAEDALATVAATR